MTKVPIVRQWLAWPILSVNMSWFYKPLVNDARVAFFRSLKSELFLARDKASAKLRFVNDIFEALIDRVEFPEVDIPDILEGADYKTLTPEVIERIADDLRDYWSLGDDPIDDLMMVIENAGVAVSEDYVDFTNLMVYLDGLKTDPSFFWPRIKMVGSVDASMLPMNLGI